MGRWSWRAALACGAAGVFFATQNVLVGLASHAPPDWEWSAMHQVVYWVAWGAFVPLVIAAARRWRLERGPAASAVVARHLALMLGVAAGQTVAAFALHWLVVRVVDAGAVAPLGAWLVARGPSLLWYVLAGLVYYWAIVGLYYAFEYQRLYSEQRIAGARLAADLADARLTGLTAQLQPHFLFNALNSIAVLTGEDPPRAGHLVRRLADLLRATLERDGAHETSLRDEVALTQRYLDIQQARFGDRLRVLVDVEPTVNDVLVPRLLLQPLVENAIRHAVEQRESGGDVVIRAHGAGDMLLVDIADDGPGLERSHATGSGGTGVGLANTRARLEQLYGARHDFAIASTPQGGVVVHIGLPLRPAPAAQRA